MTKSELYYNIIKIHKEHGQGLSGLVVAYSDENRQYMNELIDEGLIKRCDTGGSLGDPESNMFYTPTKGYNVWEDDGTDGEYIRHKGRYLTFVRLYLGILPEIKKSILDITALECLQNPEVMKNYSDWLNRNEVLLKEMLELSSDYIEENTILTDIEKKWIADRSWYIDNSIVSDCLERSIKYTNDYDKYDDRIIEISKELLTLYKTDVDKYSDSIKKAEADIEKINKNRLIRKRVNRWLSEQKQTAKIKKVLKIK